MNKSGMQGRLVALLEVVGIFVIGTLIARLVSGWLDLGPSNLRSLKPGVTPDFVRLSWSSAVNLILRYGIVLGLAVAVGWWHRRRRLFQYGVTTAERSWREHISIGVLLFSVVGLLPLLLKFLSEYLPLGQGPQHWSLIESLQSPGVWLYLFVGSFGLVPIAEELLARGYIQSRLSEDFGAPPAILITAFFFTFSHTQYFIASVIGIGMLVSLFIASVAGGYIRYRTGSVLPVIIAHSLGNLPFRGWVEPAVLGMMIMVVVMRARVIYEYAVELWHFVMVRNVLTSVIAGLMALIVVLAQVLLAPILLPISATIALAAALILEFREKRSLSTITIKPHD